MAHETVTCELPQELAFQSTEALSVSQNPVNPVPCSSAFEASGLPNPDEREDCELAALVRYRLEHPAPLVMVPLDEL